MEVGQFHLKYSNILHGILAECINTFTSVRLLVKDVTQRYIFHS